MTPQRRTSRQTAPQMQRVITQLMGKYKVDVRVSEAFLWLARPEHTEGLIIERIDERYLSGALARAERLGYFTLAPQLFFATDAAGWIPIHLDGAEPVDDLTDFAEEWAQRILEEGWLGRGKKLPDPSWVINQEALWEGEAMRRCALVEEEFDSAEVEPCPKMQLLIERLAFKHQFNLSVVGNQLLLAMPDSAERLMLVGLSSQRIGFTHCVADGGDQLMPDWDLVFLVVEEYLQPMELVHSMEIGRRYWQAAGEGNLDENEIDLAYFSEYVADRLERQRWIQDARRIE